MTSLMRIELPFKREDFNLQTKCGISDERLMITMLILFNYFLTTLGMFALFRKFPSFMRSTWSFIPGWNFYKFATELCHWRYSIAKVMFIPVINIPFIMLSFYQFGRINQKSLVYTLINLWMFPVIGFIHISIDDSLSIYYYLSLDKLKNDNSKHLFNYLSICCHSSNNRNHGSSSLSSISTSRSSSMNGEELYYHNFNRQIVDDDDLYESAIIKHAPKSHTYSISGFGTPFMSPNNSHPGSKKNSALSSPVNQTSCSLSSAKESESQQNNGTVMRLSRNKNGSKIGNGSRVQIQTSSTINTLV